MQTTVTGRNGKPYTYERTTISVDSFTEEIKSVVVERMRFYEEFGHKNPLKLALSELINYGAKVYESKNEEQQVSLFEK